MASSSSSFSYDVFLSFRGEDTRKSFVDHLYTALVKQGIQTYKDDETLARGESIGPALMKAIEESQIAVIVFSINYADSSWCLDELTYIIECMENKGQIVMPVFYDIDASDVKNQKGKYGEAFTKHDRGNNKYKTELWREALVKAGNLSGWVPKDFANGHEAKCIKDIVATISHRLSPLLTNVSKDIIGMESRLQDLKSKMEIGSSGVRMVGIWGVGGGGKTTLASAAYTEFSHKFEAGCLLQNIRDESSKHGLKKLQENLLSFILKTDVNLGSEIEGKSMIKRKLCHKSVLIVLDDVNEVKQLEALAGSHDWFGEGSRILITTRDEHLLTRRADKIYEVSLLSHDEAIKLFNIHAYRKENPIEDYEKLSLDVVLSAGGLPLALEVLGSFLYDKNKDEWISALAKLKHIPNREVTERLKISYDGLEPDEKGLFLDIACFLRRWRIDRAMLVLDACSFNPGIGVKVLVQKSLINVSNGVFDMHDLIEEMAHYIVRGKHNNLEKQSRIWKEEDIVDLSAMEAAPPLMDTEVIDFGSSGSHPRLPDVVANMKKLRWICWRGYPASSFPPNFQPTKIGFLNLIGGRHKQLWQGCLHLPRLKILHIRDSCYLVKTPDFNGLPCLERLTLSCRSLKEIHPSIGYHERLVYVSMTGCKDLKTFPPIIRMKKLETLDLFRCVQLQKFPDIQTNMDSLEILVLSYTDIEVIPRSVGQFCTNLVSFEAQCNKLKRIEGDFRLLKRLKHLHISGFYEVYKLLGDFFDKDSCLEVLSLDIKRHDSKSFKKMMNRIKLQCFKHDNSVILKYSPQFPRFLRRLNLRWCHLGNEDIPYEICELLNLQILDLTGNNFTRIHSGLLRIPCLKCLKLSHCKSLVELPDLPLSIAILIADYCDALQRLGDLTNYKWLWKVSLVRRNKLIIGERVLHSLLQGNAVQDRFMSVIPSVGRQPKIGDTMTSITLQLPHNWHSDFSGFLLCADNTMFYDSARIVIKQAMSMDAQPDHDHWEEFDKNPESYEYRMLGYVPFGSLRHTRWWNPAHTMISFEAERFDILKVGLVPRTTEVGDSRGSIVDRSEYWDKEREDVKTFEIIDNWRSSGILDIYKIRL